MHVIWSQLKGIVGYLDVLLVFVFFLFITCTALAGRVFWPFHPWGLWGVIQPTEKVYYELEVADARGTRLRYDQNAAPPILPTQLHQLGEIFIEPKNILRREQLARFLLDRANAHRNERLAGGPSSTWVKFPAREFGTTWTRADLEACGPFTQIVASKRRAELPASGPGGPTVTVIAESSWP